MSTEPAREEAPGVVGGGGSGYLVEIFRARPARLPPPLRKGVEGKEEEHRGCVALLTIAPLPPPAL